jgi:hypothetical protein
MNLRKKRTALLNVVYAAGRQQAQQEIATFLKALNSYPDSFARDPYLNFQQHLISVAAQAGLSTFAGYRKP